MSLREKLLATKENLIRKEVEIADFEFPVFAREMTGRERHEYELAIEAIRDEDGNIASTYPLKVKLVQMVTEDEDRASVFTVGDLEPIKLMPERIIDAIYKTAAVLSGLITPQEAASEDDEDDELGFDEEDEDEEESDEEAEPKNVAGAAGAIS